MSEYRILHIINGMTCGGAESYIMNIYRNMDRKKIQFDFLLRDNHRDSSYINEIKRLGGNVFFVPPFPKHFLKNYIETKHFLNKHNCYHAVEIHGNALIYVIPLFIAKRLHFNHIIMHSHSTKCAKKLYEIVHRINRIYIHRMTDVCLACSKEAGKWMFKSDFTVVPNAIDIEKYTYPNRAKEYKEEYVLCNVARFLEVKNHSFLIDLFYKFQTIHPDSRLILVGEGPLKEKIIDKVKKLRIDAKVEFPGEVTDVENYLANATCFLLPSLYEGIPLTLIEAQAAGVPCIVSDRVNREVNITENVYFASLEHMGYWIDLIEKSKNTGKCKKEDILDKMSAAGYDIRNNIRSLVELYTQERK